MKKFRGIIFDFNGTVILDDEKHYAGWQRYTAELGLSISEDDYYEHMHGSTNAAIYEYLYKKPVPEREMDTFGQPKERYYRDMFEKDPPAFAKGVEEFIAFLKKHDIPHAIATSSEISNVTFYRKIYDLDRWFGGPVIYDDGTVKGKPAPDLYLKAGRALSIPMNQLVTVEDSCSGAQACRASGSGMVVGVCPRGAEKFRGREYTDKVITDFTELDYRHLFEF